MMTTVNNKPKIEKGLKGVYSTETGLSDVNGTDGILTVKGYDISELAFKASFEDVVNLLLYNKREGVKELKDNLAKLREIPDFTLESLKFAVKNKLSVFEALQMALSTLFPSFNNVKTYKKELIIAVFPTLIAYYWRLKANKKIIKPKSDLGHVANFLYMLEGTEPTNDRVQALQTYLNTVMDHGMNASTWVSRSIASSDADLLSCVLGGLGSLKGPKHGGAPGPALDLVLAVAKAEDPEKYIRSLLENDIRLPGFGHRIYKTRDPRADVFKKAGALFYTNKEKNIDETFKKTEVLILKLLEEYKPGRQLHTNVEFYTAYLLHGLGIDRELFTPLFGMSRVVGWIAHADEQKLEDTLIRPESYYTGLYNLKW